MHRTWTNNDKLFSFKAIHESSNSHTKSLVNNTKPYPIKPSKNVIPKDLNLQKIFSNMLKTSQDFTNYYSFSIIDSNLENNSRRKLFKKIREYFISNLIEYKIYYKTILLFDIITIENEKIKLLDSIEEIAIGALILSIKFNYDENKMFSMKKLLKFYGENVFTLNKIFDIERKALKIINYFLNYSTPMCFLEFFLLNGIIYNIDELNQSDYHRIYTKIENVLEKLMEESNNYLKYNFFYLTCAVVSYTRQIFHLERWPLSLKKVFSVDFSIFEKEYNTFFALREKLKEIKPNNKNNYNYSTYQCHQNKDLVFNKNKKVVFLDIKKINDDNNNKDNSINYKNNCSIYRKNNFKTINHCNGNIINININNISLNSIYSASTSKNIKPNNFLYNSSYNSTYNSSNNTINNDSQRSIRKYKYEGVYRKSISKNKNRFINLNSSNYKLKNNLEEIKEVKDFIELKTYISPNKRRKSRYLNKREKKENDYYKLKEEDSKYKYQNPYYNENNNNDNYIYNPDNINF